MLIFSELCKVDLGPFGNKLFIYAPQYKLQTMYKLTMLPLSYKVTKLLTE